MVGNTVLTSAKPMKVATDVAASITARPKGMNDEDWSRWTRQRRGCFIVSDEEAAQWDASEYKDPNPDVSWRPDNDDGPKIPVVSNIKGLIGNVVASRGETVLVAEKLAIQNYYFSGQSGDRNISRCTPDPSTFTPRGKSYFTRLEKYAADHRGQITSTLLDFPKY
jgi:hypothetical protein